MSKQFNSCGSLLVFISRILCRSPLLSSTHCGGGCFMYFNFQISCLISRLVCCFTVWMAGLWVDWWADGQQSLCPFGAAFFYDRSFQSLTDVHRFAGACCARVLRGHTLVILIWVLSISHSGVERLNVPNATVSHYTLLGALWCNGAMTVFVVVWCRQMYVGLSHQM